MGDAVHHLDLGVALDVEVVVDGSVAGGEHAVGLGVARLGHQIDRQAVGKNLEVGRLAEGVVGGLKHGWPPRFPCP
ncbi:hypothetical protein D3C87_2047500 [compost metagenome]